jgi:hypothetical protein
LHDFDSEGPSVEHNEKERLKNAARYNVWGFWKYISTGISYIVARRPPVCSNNTVLPGGKKFLLIKS